MTKPQSEPIRAWDWSDALNGLLILAFLGAVGYAVWAGKNDPSGIILTLLLLVLIVLALIGLIRPTWVHRPTRRQVALGYLSGALACLIALPLLLPPQPPAEPAVVAAPPKPSPDAQPQAAAQAQAQAEAEATQAKAKAEAEAKVDYRIIEDNSLARIKRMVVVELPSAVDARALVPIAQAIRDGSGIGYERTFVNFCLAGQPCSPRRAGKRSASCRFSAARSGRVPTRRVGTR